MTTPTTTSSTMAASISTNHEDDHAHANKVDDEEEDDSDSSSVSSSNEDRLTAQEGLSSETLQALLEFQQFGGAAGWDRTDEDAEDPPDAIDSSTTSIPSSAVCVAYTAKDSQVIAQTLQRLQQKYENQSSPQQEGQDDDKPSMSSCDIRLDPSDIPTLQAPELLSLPGMDVAERTRIVQSTLEQEGVVRINHVLDRKLCEECRTSILRALEHDEGGKTSCSTNSANSNDNNPTYGFGNVFSRTNRYDMYWRPEGMYQTALQQLFYHNPSNQPSTLGHLLLSLVGTEQSHETYFHEWSSLVADPGCDHQPLHPDAPYAPLPPMWTIFVALQDIDSTMGPTVLLPQSHLQDVTQFKRNSLSSSLSLQTATSYRQATLQQGDCIVMDARTWHFGSANVSKTSRRVLLYCTIRNPHHGSTDNDFPPNGSLFPDLQHNMTLSHYCCGGSET